MHPWRVHELADGWQGRLRDRLCEHPGAIVGEIGLCKCAKNLRGPGAKAKNWPLQIQAFDDQLQIAAALGRPASIHCVKAHGTLLDCLSAAPALPENECSAIAGGSAGAALRQSSRVPCALTQ